MPSVVLRYARGAPRAAARYASAALYTPRCCRHADTTPRRRAAVRAAVRCAHDEYAIDMRAYNMPRVRTLPPRAHARDATPLLPRRHSGIHAIQCAAAACCYAMPRHHYYAYAATPPSCRCARRRDMSRAAQHTLKVTSYNAEEMRYAIIQRARRQRANACRDARKQREDNRMSGAARCRAKIHGGCAHDARWRA